MTSEEMKTEFNALYNMMANSQKIEYMHTFGNVHREMFEWFVSNKPELAQEWLDKLESIRWRQYLTPKEAEKIVAGMNPKAPWSREAWNNAMDSLGLVKEESPYYNRCALWVEMNKQYSDQGTTVAELIGMPLAQIPADKIVPAMYKMALNLLKDRDNVYDIRKYFSL